jgi:3-oxoacyl-[acyl-carrier protein] reductase
MLTNKVAVITGGARGIGAGIARVMAGQGARVALLDIDRTEAEKTASGLPTPGMALACDASIEGV